MTLDPLAERLLRRFGAFAGETTANPSPADLRNALKQLVPLASPPPPADRLELAIEVGERSIPARAYAPPGRKDDALPGLVFFHGGGGVAGGLDTHDAFCATLAASAACRVLAIDYRLAPEHRFPAARQDAIAAASAVASQARAFAINPQKLGLCGDSSGANLAIQVALEARRSEQFFCLQALICPALEVAPATASRRALARGYLLEETTLEAYWRDNRVDGLAADDWRVSPLHAPDFRGLPPAIVHVAEYDPLRDEGADYVEALRRDGVAASLVVHQGLIHSFQSLGAAIPAAKAALEAFCAEVSRALHANQPLK